MKSDTTNSFVTFFSTGKMSKMKYCFLKGKQVLVMEQSMCFLEQQTPYFKRSLKLITML